uniref:Uncharacterized protein n=1 Tax=Fagus sylvatica TaxID=28930 RepID=A0A2N9JAZ0_FAGSY
METPQKDEESRSSISSAAAAPALTFEAATDAHPDPDSTNNISYGLKSNTSMKITNGHDLTPSMKITNGHDPTPSMKITNGHH